MSSMDLGSNLQWSTASTITSWHHLHSTVTKNYQNLTHLWQCNNVRVHLYAYVPHWKERKHFIYVHCGCGKKASKVDYRLNRDIMASFLLNSHPELLKTNQASAVQQCKTALMCLHTSLKGAKTLYTYPIWLWEAIEGGLHPQPWHHGIISTR